MKIVVCIKQVPATTTVKMDPVTKRLVREGVQSIVNPYDLYALEKGLQLKEQWNELAMKSSSSPKTSELIVLTMGPTNAELALREGIAMGADRAILLSDRKFGGSDTWATSFILSAAIKRLGDVELILCGKHAIDGDTAQVGPGIASHLNIAQATNVIEVKIINHKIIATRLFEDSSDTVELMGGAMLACEKVAEHPRIPSLNSWRLAHKKTIEIWDNEILQLDDSKLGLNGSPTRVVKTNRIQGLDKSTLFLDDPSNATSHILTELIMRKLI